MEPTELFCPSEAFQNEMKRLTLYLMRGRLSLRMMGLEVSCASGLLYSERFVILLKLVVSCCDYENYGNQA